MLGLSRTLYVVLLIYPLGYLTHAESCRFNELDNLRAASCHNLYKPVLLNGVELRAQIEEYKEKYNDVDEKLVRMQQNLTRQEILIDYQKDQLAKLNVKLAMYEGREKDKGRPAERLESSIEISGTQLYQELLSQFNKLKSDLSAKESSQAKIISLEKQLETSAGDANLKSKEIVNLKSKIRELQKRSEENNREINKLRSDVHDRDILIKNRSVAFDGEVSLKSKEIASLKSDLISRDNQLSSYRQIVNNSLAESCLSFEGSTDIHTMKIPGMDPFVAPCDNGEMVIQRRIDGSVDFNRTWQDYKNGFGNIHGEFWLGLEKLHKLTTSREYKLSIEVVDMSNHKFTSTLSGIQIGSEAEEYRLKMPNYNLNSEYGIFYHRGMGFTTIDRDNDEDRTKNLAVYFKGGWWHKLKKNSNLNAVFGDDDFWYNGGEGWMNRKIKSCRMLIRPVAVYCRCY